MKPHDLVDGYATYGDYSGRDWRDDYDIRELLVRISVGAEVSKGEAFGMALVLTQRMTHAEDEFTKRAQ